MRNAKIMGLGGGREATLGLERCMGILRTRFRVIDGRPRRPSVCRLTGCSDPAVELGYCARCLVEYRCRRNTAISRRDEVAAALAASLEPLGIERALRERVGEIGATYAQLAHDDVVLAEEHFLDVAEHALSHRSAP